MTIMTVNIIMIVIMTKLKCYNYEIQKENHNYAETS